MRVNNSDKYYIFLYPYAYHNIYLNYVYSIFWKEKENNTYYMPNHKSTFLLISWLR